MKSIDELIKIMVALREPDQGCPWDREQTHQTILPHTIEEVYEIAEAIQCGNTSQFKDELGDLLFQIIFYCQIANEHGDFDFNDVTMNLNEKLTRRHPHVFADAEIKTASDLGRIWEQIKREERAADGKTDDGLLDNISSAMPALIHAKKLQKKAAIVGFDWDETAPVIAKVEEELAEIKAEIDKNESEEKIAEEIGDMLFACVNLARHLNIDAETALMSANRKFKQRFSYIETKLKQQGKALDEASLDEMEALWEESKT
ncbi:MAG: nucleoside triphosphate pyrophosphohydrolase [Gammaproteobacteria bacterium]|nr:nucleoside triphosphate pyrophosphohydrolase [Gammaproteobacteria bacterium]